MSCDSSTPGRDTPGDPACPGQVSGDLWGHPQLTGCHPHWKPGSQDPGPKRLLCLHPVVSGEAGSGGGVERRTVRVLGRSGSTHRRQMPTLPCAQYPRLRTPKIPGILPARSGVGTLNPRDFSAAAAGSTNRRTALPLSVSCRARLSRS